MQAGPANSHNPERAQKCTLLHFTINSNQHPHTVGEFTLLESRMREQVQTFVDTWPAWLAAESLARVEAPAYEGGVEVGARKGRVHAHLVMLFAHTTWVDLKQTRAKIKAIRRTLGLTLFAYVSVQVANAAEAYMKMYARKEGGIRISGVAKAGPKA